MARTTEDEVSKVIKVKSNLAEQEALTRAVTTANIMVTRVCVPHGDGYDETDAADIALLAQIETYLAAHFFSIFKPRRSYEQAGSVSQRVISKVDMGLKLTHHGQQAILLDINGGLAALDKQLENGGMKPSLAWLGTEY